MRGIGAKLLCQTAFTKFLMCFLKFFSCWKRERKIAIREPHFEVLNQHFLVLNLPLIKLGKFVLNPWRSVWSFVKCRTLLIFQRLLPEDVLFRSYASCRSAQYLWRWNNWQWWTNVRLRLPFLHLLIWHKPIKPLSWDQGYSKPETDHSLDWCLKTDK